MALPPEQEKGTPPPTQPQQNPAQTIINRINDINSRLRLVEQRINQNRERLSIYDDQLLNLKKEVGKELDSINDSIMELRKSIKNIEDTIQHIIRELESTAKKQDINVIEKYVDMMDPTRYVTKEELKELLGKNGK